MAIALRLSRGGAKKRPYYRIVAADNRSPRDGKYLEQIGIYNPLLAKDDEGRVKLDEDRARYWLGVGAQPSDRVARFLDAAGIRERAARNNPQRAEPGEKAKERAEEREAKQAEAAEAAKAAEEEAKAEAAKPAEDAAEENEGAAAETVATAGADAPDDANTATPKGEAGDQDPIPGESSQEPAEGAAPEVSDTADEAKAD